MSSKSASRNSSDHSKMEIPKKNSDMVLEHGISLDGEDAMQYVLCDDMMPDRFYRFYRFLCRLARIKHVSGAHKNCGDKKEECARVKVREKGKGDSVVTRSSEEDVFKKMVYESEAKNKDILREEASEAIARFFYYNAIPVKVVESTEFIAMCDLISSYGVGYKPPSTDGINEKYLTKDKVLEEHKVVWKTRGCTIMIDAWTDKKRRTILNLFANGLKGTYFLKSIDATDMMESETPFKLFKMMDDIVEEVGEENVVQIVTDNTPFYKAAGEMLMEKWSKLYWTPCVTHCIEMILEDYENKIPIYEKTITKAKRITTLIYRKDSIVSLLHTFTTGIDLVKPSITRCATSYLTLNCLYENKGALRKMFKSKEWKSSQFAKTSAGKSVEDVVFDKEFWKNVLICLKGADPLIKVLRLVNSIDEPATGFIYEVMEQAKEYIRSNLSIESFMPLWKIIDERWDKQHLNPLHAAGYFLNPQFHYCIGFRDDNIIMRGLHRCITRMVASPEERSKIEIQLDDFHNRANLLGDPVAIMTAGYEIPTVWWAEFGGGLPELQSFALRVLSLTCSSYGSESNKSGFKSGNDVGFVMANSKLGEKRKGEGLDVDDLDYDMISDLHDEYGNGDEDGDEDGDQIVEYWC